MNKNKTRTSSKLASLKKAAVENPSDPIIQERLRICEAKERGFWRKNVYLCDTCGWGFISSDVDKGTTPFMTACIACKGLATSMCYNIPQEILHDKAAAVEWYIPSKSERQKLSPGEQLHVDKGGLISRLVKLGRLPK